jgi:hypothetical protein
VFAIPSLHVYTTGAELHIIYRTSGAHPRTTEQAQQTTERLGQLKVNGRQVTLLGGEHKDHGYNYRAWIAFRPDDAGHDLVFSLQWPGITPAEHGVPAATIADGSSRVTTLWPS